MIHLPRADEFPAIGASRQSTIDGNFARCQAARMSDQDVISNQKLILENQKTILALL